MQCSDDKGAVSETNKRRAEESRSENETEPGVLMSVAGLCRLFAGRRYGDPMEVLAEPRAQRVESVVSAERTVVVARILVSCSS